MNSPLFSIITITFNAGRVLPATMLSVGEQSFHDFEHIIVDGASSDDTISIARDYATPDLRIISEKDRGLYDAMNKGLKMAKGKYLIFLNAGDSFASFDTLSLYADAAKWDADIIYSDTVIVNDRREIIRPRHLSVPDRLTFDSFSQGMLVCHQAFCVKRSLAPEYNLDYRFSADYDWTIRCIRNAHPDQCVNLGVVGIHYLDDGMTERNKWASLRERYEIMVKYYGQVRTLLNHLKFAVRAMRRCNK